MPLKPGSGSETVSDNIRELHGGKTYAHTRRKFGAGRANKQAVAIALSNARKTESLRVGDTSAEGVLKIVKGPFKNEDEAGNAITSRDQVVWSSGTQWWVAVHLAKKVVEDLISGGDRS